MAVVLTGKRGFEHLNLNELSEPFQALSTMSTVAIRLLNSDEVFATTLMNRANCAARLIFKDTETLPSAKVFAKSLSAATSLASGWGTWQDPGRKIAALKGACTRYLNSQTVNNLKSMKSSLERCPLNDLIWQPLLKLARSNDYKAMSICDEVTDDASDANGIILGLPPAPRPARVRQPKVAAQKKTVNYRTHKGVPGTHSMSLRGTVPVTAPVVNLAQAVHNVPLQAISVPVAQPAVNAPVTINVQPTAPTMPNNLPSTRPSTAPSLTLSVTSAAPSTTAALSHTSGPQTKSTTGTADSANATANVIATPSTASAIHSATSDRSTIKNGTFVLGPAPNATDTSTTASTVSSSDAPTRRAAGRTTIDSSGSTNSSSSTAHPSTTVGPAFPSPILNWAGPINTGSPMVPKTFSPLSASTPITGVNGTGTGSVSFRVPRIPARQGRANSYFQSGENDTDGSQMTPTTLQDVNGSSTAFGSTVTQDWDGSTTRSTTDTSTSSVTGVQLMAPTQTGSSKDVQSTRPMAPRRGRANSYFQSGENDTDGSQLTPSTLLDVNGSSTAFGSTVTQDWDGSTTRSTTDTSTSSVTGVQLMAPTQTGSSKDVQSTRPMAPRRGRANSYFQSRESDTDGSQLTPSTLLDVNGSSTAFGSTVTQDWDGTTTRSTTDTTTSSDGTGSSSKMFTVSTIGSRAPLPRHQTSLSSGTMAQAPSASSSGGTQSGSSDQSSRSRASSTPNTTQLFGPVIQQDSSTNGTTATRKRRSESSITEGDSEAPVEKRGRQE